MTIGEYLRQKRLEKQVSLEQVSAGTNIRINFLEAIEKNQLDIIPSVSQARGFIRLYATYLGLTPEKVFDEVERANRPVEPIFPPGQDKPVIDIHKASASAAIGKQASINRMPGQKKETSDLRKELPVSKSQAIFEEIGRDLRQQREALGLSCEDVERQLKIREFYISALESGKIDDLPSTVQGRGMLNNYASFIDLDPESLQMRYADGLQQRRLEKNLLDVELHKEGKSVIGKEPLSGWRRVLTPDLLIGGTVLILLFSLVIWGAVQVIRTSIPQKPVSTLSSISEVLVGTQEPETTGTPLSPSVNVAAQTGTPEILTTPLVDLQATLNAIPSGKVQVVIVALQRAYLRVSVDGKEEFAGRVIPGNVYSFAGATKINLLTGNAAGLQVYYNQVDQGVLGLIGQVVEMEYTSGGLMTPTPRFTATPTVTQRPTLTPFPTSTPFPTATIPTVTITPAIP